MFLVIAIIAAYGLYYYQKVKTEETIHTIRKFYVSVNNHDRFMLWKDSVKNGKVTPSPDIEYGVLVNTIFFKSPEIKAMHLKSLDSLTQSTAFEEAHPLHKFYTNYYISFGYYSYSDYKNSLKYYKKANEYINEDYQKYKFEREKLQKLTSHIFSYFVKDYSILIPQNVKKLEEAMAENDSNLIANTAYNLAYFHLEDQQYEEALKYSQMTKNYLGKLYNNSFFNSNQVIEITSYAHLERKDTIPTLINQMRYLNEKGLLEEDKYNMFELLLLSDLYNVYPLPYTEKRALELVSKYEKNKEDQYPLFVLHKLLAQYYADNQEVNKEIYHRSQMFESATQMGEISNEYHKEALTTSQKLIAIYDSIHDPQKTLSWFFKKEKLLDRETANQLSYMNMIEFFSNRELDYAQTEAHYQKKSADQKSNIIIIISVFVIVLLLALQYIINLFRKNKKYQSRIENKSELLKEKNKKISIQNTELETVLKQLQETNENLENFAKVAAHDIKSPMSSISQISQFLEMKYKNIIDVEDQECFQFLNESTQNLSHMINTLLNYSKNDPNVIQNTSIDLVRVFHTILQNLQSDVDTRNAQITFPKEIPNVRGNGELLTQLFQNLIQNALKFQREDEVPIIEISSYSELGNKVLIAIKDNGIGISKENQKEIFKVFQRADEVEIYEGSGIGLATCKRIAEDHGGEIWVESELGKGTTFFIQLVKYEESFTPNKLSAVN